MFWSMASDEGVGQREGCLLLNFKRKRKKKSDYPSLAGK